MKDSQAKLAIEIFDTAHKAAIVEYKKFWMNLFQNYGFAVEDDTSYANCFSIKFGGREFGCMCRPAFYTGVKVWGRNNSMPERKFMSESGILKWLKLENLGTPPKNA